jgi:hypothetical protein
LRVESPIFPAEREGPRRFDATVWFFSQLSSLNSQLHDPVIMTRSLLQPIRTRRMASFNPSPTPGADKVSALTPATRKTLAAIGALWVSFGANSALAASPVSVAR